MGYLEMLNNELRGKKQMLARLQTDKETYKKQIAELEKEIISCEKQIIKQEAMKERERRVEEIGEKIPSEIKKSFEYDSSARMYIWQNSAPYIRDMILTDDGKVIFLYGGNSEIDSGKRIMQVINGDVYDYEETRAYNQGGKNLTDFNFFATRTNSRSGTQEKFSVFTMLSAGKWNYRCLAGWKEIEDISKLPLEELLSDCSISDELKKFFYENYVSVPKREKMEEKEATVQETPVITAEGVLTVGDLKKDYAYVFDSDNGIVFARNEERDGDDIFFKDKSGAVIKIPELSYMTEEDIDGNNFRSSESYPFSSSRDGSHIFNVHECGYESQVEGRLVGRYDKYYRYVTLDDSKKVVKVFESNDSIERPLVNLYHRNKDKNGKQCIRLVDLQGNVHSIKEGGREGEEGLKEKTYGDEDDYQLKVVYKENEPVYAVFFGEYDAPRDFCTAEELRRFYDDKVNDLSIYGISIDEDDACFGPMAKVIENFNETFMRGDFAPSPKRMKVKQEDKSLAELAEELAILTDIEKESKQLLAQYEQLLPNQDQEI